MVKQKKNIARLVILQMIILLMMQFSCEQKTEWELQSGDERFLIVDGIITNEFKYQSVKLSISNTDLNQAVIYAEDAVVSVSDGDNIHIFSESDTLPGTYWSETEFAGVINKKYTLNIEFENKEYTADAEMLPVSISGRLPCVNVPDTNLYYIAADLVVFDPNEAYMAEVLLDWSDLPGYDTVPESETAAQMFFYRLKTIDVNQIFSPAIEPVYFPEGTYMIQKKYSITPEHEKFIRSLLFETQWHGGNFDLEEGNVYTNLSGGALGFFGACSVIADTSFVH